jgi:hypothetical protein
MEMDVKEIGFHKGGKFDYLSDYKLVKKDSAPCSSF